jgi:predicted metalloprotease with PDZ domain
MLRIAHLLAGLSLLPAATISKPQRLEYTLRVDPADLSGIAVELRVRAAPAGVRLAAHAHPEYDDKYWRHVEDLRVTTADGESLSVARADSSVWSLANPAGDVIVRYRVRFPREEGVRSPWRPFLAPTGGLVGGPHSFLYVIGQEKAPASVTLDLPDGWQTASGLSGPTTARRFDAPDLHTLLESPMLVGELRQWTFQVRGVPHRVFYWPLPNATPFDSVAFVHGIERLATEAVSMFGGMPYTEYTFLLQDGAYSGGLEHPNSVTLGALSANLARDPHAGMREIAHEFVHTWNLMAIKPVEYREVDYRVQPPVAGLWFSEGLTLYYGDLLQRRAGLPVEDSTRVARLEGLITRYLFAPGHSRFSAEAVSRVAYNASPAALGDYAASTHLQGEVIGAMLDLLVRDSTDGARSMDDVMRLMYRRFTDRGFTGADVQTAVNEVCGCRVDAFFDAHVRGGNAIAFDQYLRPLGLRVTTTWQPAMRADGQPAVDLRMWGYQQGSEPFIRLRVGDPASVWGMAGLRTGDPLVSANGAAIRAWPELRSFLASLAVDDTVSIVVQRDGGPFTTRVVLRGHDRPVVRIEQVEDASPRQRHLREAWIEGR